MIAYANYNGTYQDLVYQFLLQQFSPVPKDPADDPGNKKKMLIMVACFAALLTPLIIFKLWRDRIAQQEVDRIKEKARVQVEMATQGHKKKKGKKKKGKKLAPL